MNWILKRCDSGHSLSTLLLADITHKKNVTVNGIKACLCVSSSQTQTVCRVALKSQSCTGCPAKVALNLMVVQRKDHYQGQGSSQTITAKQCEYCT